MRKTYARLKVRNDCGRFRIAVGTCPLRELHHLAVRAFAYDESPGANVPKRTKQLGIVEVRVFEIEVAYLPLFP